MKRLATGMGLGLTIGLVVDLATAPAAHASGWASIHRYAKKTGNCAGQEILASYYHSGRRTATGERFNRNGNTAAARTYALGTTLNVTNPHNSRSLTVRINDTGPWGLPHARRGIAGSSAFADDDICGVASG